MSDRPSLADALYGPSGPSTLVGTESSRAGIAETPPPSPSTTESRPSLADALYKGDPPPEPQPQAQPEPKEETTPSAPTPNQASSLRTEFDTIADTLSLSPDETNQLLQLHDKAVKGLYEDHAATAAEWRRQAEAAFTPAQLTSLRQRFDQALGTDAPAQEFRRLLGWSGLGNHPATLHAISRLLQRRR